MVPCNWPVYCAEEDHIHDDAMTFAEVDYVPTHRINLAKPRFAYHESRNEQYAMIAHGAKFFCEFIVRQSYGHPGDCYYATRKVKFVTHAEVN